MTPATIRQIFRSAGRAARIAVEARQAREHAEILVEVLELRLRRALDQYDERGRVVFAREAVCVGRQLRSAEKAMSELRALEASAVAAALDEIDACDALFAGDDRRLWETRATELARRIGDALRSDGKHTQDTRSVGYHTGRVQLRSADTVVTVPGAG